MTIDPALESLILSRLSPYVEKVHGIVLIGSHAQGTEGEHSDVDLVVVCPDEREEELDWYAFDQEMKGDERLNIAVFSVSQAESMFDRGSPMAHAIARGIRVTEGPVLLSLVRRPLAVPPRPEYYAEAFKNNIASLWIGSVPHLTRDIRRSHAPDGTCTRRGGCLGHWWGESLARVTMRMLYLTLPSRGHIPLSKRDVVAYAVQVYGEDARDVLTVAIDIVRKDRSISYDEYTLIYPFARRLWHETLALLPDRSKYAGFLCELRQAHGRHNTQKEAEKMNKG